MKETKISVTIDNRSNLDMDCYNTVILYGHFDGYNEERKLFKFENPGILELKYAGKFELKKLASKSYYTAHIQAFLIFKISTEKITFAFDRYFSQVKGHSRTTLAFNLSSDTSKNNPCIKKLNSMYGGYKKHNQTFKLSNLLTIQIKGITKDNKVFFTVDNYPSTK